MGAKSEIVTLNLTNAVKIKKWKVKEGMLVSYGRVVFLYDVVTSKKKQELLKFKCSQVGTVQKILAREGEIIKPGGKLLILEECRHPTVMKDMCAECGADLRKDENASINASVPMVHSIPELKVSEEQAQIIGKADEKRLITDRKLVLLVDLDQTLIHTTNDNIPPNLKDVYHFQLYGPMSPWYHTRIRPGTLKFLEEVSKCYELHICTFGARNYAHMIAMFLDQDGKYFSHRILSRDECFNANSKTANLKALFPCGDNMVCIIDDREDVWNYAPNLIHVKPYHFFQHTGDIHAPPGLTKKENDDIDGFDFTKLDSESKEKKAIPNKKIDALGETTTDKDTEDEEEKSRLQKCKKETNSSKNVDSPIVSCDLELSEEDSQDASVDKDELKKKSKEKVDIVKKTDETGPVNSAVIEKNEDITLSSVTENPVDVVCNVKEKESKIENKEENKVRKEEDSKIKQEQNNKEKINVRDINKDSNNAEKSEVDDLIEVEDCDDYLLYLEDILKHIHSYYYDLYDKQDNKNIIPDLKTVIPEVKQKVLTGCHIVFSGIVPSNVILEQSRAYLVALSLGATVSQDITPNTTHLVAARPGTAKVNSARRQKGVITVTPLWLWQCAERWERLDERLYPLGRSGVANRHPPAHCGSPEHNSGGSTPTHETTDYVPTSRNRTPSGRFIDTINPLLSFSSEDIKIMDQEVEDMFKDDDDESDSESEKEQTIPIHRTSPCTKLDEDSSSSSSSRYSLSGPAHPKGWKETNLKSRKRATETTTCTESEYDEESPSVKFRRGEPLPSDLEMGEESVGSGEEPDDIDDGDWNMMGAALEREFLSGN